MPADRPHGTPFGFQFETVVIIGSGPSLLGFDFRKIRDMEATVIGINDVCRCLPWCDFFVTIDGTFLEISNPFGVFDGWKIIALPPERLNRLPAGLARRVVRFDRRMAYGLSDDPNTLHAGSEQGNSGFAALNFAYLGRASQIILLGFDLNPIAGGARSHWNRRSNASRWDHYRCGKMAKSFDLAMPQLEAAGCRVFNANRESGITTFPFMDL